MALFPPPIEVTYILYGFAFLAMGLIIVIRLEHESELELANILWLLAAFGFTHGFLEWTDLWLVIRGANPGLTTAQPIILLVSYLFLFEFGRRLVLISLSATVRAKPASRLLDVWIYAPLLGGILAGTAVSDQPAAAMTIGSRYLAGFFGSFLAGAGFLLYWRNRLKSNLLTSDDRVIRTGSHAASAAFVAYAILGGLVVPRADWFPASVINQETFLATFRVPVQLLRALCAVLAAISVEALLRIFYSEGMHRIKEALQKTQEVIHELRVAAVAFETQNAMMITDPKGVILRVNSAFTRLTGYSPEEAIGQRPALLKSGHHNQLFYQNMWDSLNEKDRWQGEVWNKSKDGRIYPELLTIAAVTTPEKGVTHYVGSYTDITQDKEIEAEIHRLAYYDPLTKLPNRRLLRDLLGHAVAATTRSKQYGAIFFIDLDNFKSLNDTRGHDIGDLLLIEVADRLRSAVRQGDMVARQGGDEFVVLLENLGADADDAAALAKQIGEKLRATTDRVFMLEDHEYHCKLSIGAGLFCGQHSVEDLLKQADLALYQAKKEGRNLLRFFDPAMQTSMDVRSAMETELRHALGLNQLHLYYQPQVDAYHRVISVEALLRWQHPQRGMVQPNDFIPLAEETGLILPIGLWVLETACSLIKAWETAASTRELRVAVNVSPRQFRQADFVAQVRTVLEASGANPAQLKLELTESLVLGNVEDTIAKMHALKRLGVGFSMDDFGTGYSSLSYLTLLPLDQLKIDRSFVLNVPGNRRDEIIAQTIVTLGRGLGLNVIAEGVETMAQREFLEAHGCHAFQGYLFSRPLPLEELDEFLKRG